MDPIRFGLVGVGRQSDWAHARAIRHSGQGVVAAICDTDQDVLRQRAEAYGVAGDRCYTRWQDLIDSPGIDAVVVATPNHLHAPVAVAAAHSGRHVLCEKPLAMDAEQAESMLSAARSRGIRHMTAFTYRFVPAMRYLRHVVASGDLGPVRAVRSRRLMDWPDDSLGWRQVRAQAASGDLGDMASHRVDYAQSLLGPVRSVQGLTRIFVRERRLPDGRPHPAEVDDWCAFIAEFDGGAVGVFESTKLARGYGRGDAGTDHLEVNGANASAFYRLSSPDTLDLACAGAEMSPVVVPEAWRAPIGRNAAPLSTDPSLAFRENQMYEFMDAIRSGRDASPSFLDGARVVAVVDAVLRAAAERRAVDVLQIR